MKIDNKSLLVLALLGGGAYYLWKKNKEVPVLTEEPSSGGGGGGGGAFPVFIPAPAPAPKPEPAPAPKPDPKPWETCKAGYTYDFGKKMCVQDVAIDKPKDTVGKEDRIFKPYDPCATYGGTYDSATNSCLKSPYCGGGTLDLAKNSCYVQLPNTGTGTGTGVLIGFSGKMPLTLDNLLH